VTMIVWDIQDTGGKVLVSKGDSLRDTEKVTVYSSEMISFSMLYGGNKILAYILNYSENYFSKKLNAENTGVYFGLLYKDPKISSKPPEHEVAYEDQSLRLLFYRHPELSYPSAFPVQDYLLVGRW